MKVISIRRKCDSPEAFAPRSQQCTKTTACQMLTESQYYLLNILGKKKSHPDYFLIICASKVMVQISVEWNFGHSGRKPICKKTLQKTQYGTLI